MSGSISNCTTTFTIYTQRAIRRMSTPEAPWIIVEGTDERYRNLTIGKVILEGLRAGPLTDQAMRPSRAAAMAKNPSADPACYMP